MDTSPDLSPSDIQLQLYVLIQLASPSQKLIRPQQHQRLYFSGRIQYVRISYRLDKHLHRAAELALLYFDFFITFEREVSRYWGTRLNFSTFLFYFNRYATFFGIIPVMFEYFWTAGSVTKSKVCFMPLCEVTILTNPQ